MTDSSTHITKEIDDHKADLNTWVNDINGRDIPQSYRGVSDRFIRDCQTLATDLDKQDVSAADLCDFVDTHNSLEIRYHNIIQDLP